LGAAHGVESFGEPGIRQAILREEAFDFGGSLAGKREKNVLDAGEVVFEFGSDFLRRIENGPQIGTEIKLLSDGAGTLGAAVKQRIKGRTEGTGINPDFRQQRAGEAFVLIQQSGEKMETGHFGMTACGSERLGGLESFLELEGELIGVHTGELLSDLCLIAAFCSKK